MLAPGIAVLAPGIAVLALVFGCGEGCGEDTPIATRARAAELPPEPAEQPPAEPRPPGYPLIDDSVLLRAPARYDHLVPRLVPPTGPRFRNLVYEANNLAMRGPRDEENGFYESTGHAIAQRWRDAAAGVKQVFALRDALFSQQDHPIDHDPVAIMMPPGWVSIAVHEVMQERTVQPVHAPPIDADEEWAAFATPATLFGSFPPSERLHEVATRPRTVLAPERLRVTNARRAVHMLAADAQAMLDVAAEGADAVANAGADRISRSDILYFGERLRREHIIPISVENPNAHEQRDEDKGLRPFGYDVSDEAVGMVRRAIYQRRLDDGDIAIERYHIGRPEERQRAIAVLRELVGTDLPGEHRVWLWVHGGLDARGIRGRDATPYIGGFRAEVASHGVNMERVRFLSKPHVPIGGRNLAAQLDANARRFRGIELPLSLNIGSNLLHRLFTELER